METLFDIDEIKETPSTKRKQCNNLERWKFNHTTIFYCGVRKSNRTENGKLKIKANKTSCFQFINH
jgi:hypothetical protein